MESFLKANPGLRSRFDRFLRFEDYSAEELFQISNKMVADSGYELEKEASDHLRNYFSFLFQYRDRYFGNARTVRTVVGQAVKNQNLRLASLKDENKKGTNLKAITLKDVSEFERNTDQFVISRNRIGFRSSDR